MRPNVSTAIGTNSWEAGRVAYLLRFRSAACSAAPPGTHDDRQTCEASHVWMAVKSQAMYFPLAHGTSVAASGLLPSVLMRPDGSFVQGVSAFVRALHTKSLTAQSVWLIFLQIVCKPVRGGLLDLRSLRTDIGVGYTDPAQDAIQWPIGLPRCSDLGRHF